MKTTRRIFLKSGAMALASVGIIPALGPEFLRRAVWADDAKGPGRRKTLVCIFLRGAVDGLSVVVPHGDPNYYKLRSVGAGGIAIARTGQDGVVDLDGQFGLHPALSMLKPIYDAGHMGAIHAVGSPNPTRSHFDAQDYMESAAPGNKGIHTGWLARAMAACPEDARNGAKISTVSLTAQVPRSLDGDREALAIPNLQTFGIGRDGKAMSIGGGTGDTSGGFEALYAGAVGDVLHGAGAETFDAVKTLNGLDPARYRPARGANYSRSPLGQSLQQIAQLVKANLGLEVAFAEAGGWDTHVGQGGAQGNLARRLADLGQALAAFYTDLGDRMGDVTVLTMSEFGRTARQNGDGGTDHGHGTCFLTLGGQVAGGKVLGDWPGLAPNQLNDGRDLAVTTDFRRIFGEVANKQLGVTDFKTVFPEYALSPRDFRGVLKS
ncbi:hypothetical protein IAD21_05682 [Abditibacteriota bacterium]|nr:hypothetical protein IAD21_05682 [Abditibacteriota bacterium]